MEYGVAVLKRPSAKDRLMAIMDSKKNFRGVRKAFESLVEEGERDLRNAIDAVPRPANPYRNLLRLPKFMKALRFLVSRKTWYKKKLTWIRWVGLLHNFHRQDELRLVAIRRMQRWVRHTLARRRIMFLSEVTDDVGGVAKDIDPMSAFAKSSVRLLRAQQATIIQTYIRRWLASFAIVRQVDIKRMYLLNKYATHIQKIYRGYFCRAMFCCIEKQQLSQQLRRWAQGHSQKLLRWDDLSAAEHQQLIMTGIYTASLSSRPLRKLPTLQAIIELRAKLLQLQNKVGNEHSQVRATYANRGHDRYLMQLQDLHSHFFRNLERLKAAKTAEELRKAQEERQRIQDEEVKTKQRKNAMSVMAHFTLDQNNQRVERENMFREEHLTRKYVLALQTKAQDRISTDRVQMIRQDHLSAMLREESLSIEKNKQDIERSADAVRVAHLRAAKAPNFDAQYNLFSSSLPWWARGADKRTAEEIRVDDIKRIIHTAMGEVVFHARDDIEFRRYHQSKRTTGALLCPVEDLSGTQSLTCYPILAEDALIKRGSLTELRAKRLDREQTYRLFFEKKSKFLHLHAQLSRTRARLISEKFPTRKAKQACQDQATQEELLLPDARADLIRHAHALSKAYQLELTAFVKVFVPISTQTSVPSAADAYSSKSTSPKSRVSTAGTRGRSGSSESPSLSVASVTESQFQSSGVASGRAPATVQHLPSDQLRSMPLVDVVEETPATATPAAMSTANKHARWATGRMGQESAAIEQFLPSEEMERRYVFWGSTVCDSCRTGSVAGTHQSQVHINFAFESDPGNPSGGSTAQTRLLPPPPYPAARYEHDGYSYSKNPGRYDKFIPRITRARGGASLKDMFGIDFNDNSSVSSGGGSPSGSSTGSPSTSGRRQSIVPKAAARHVSRANRRRAKAEAAAAEERTKNRASRKPRIVPGFAFYTFEDAQEYDFIQWANDIQQWCSIIDDWICNVQDSWRLAHRAALISLLQREQWLRESHLSDPACPAGEGQIGCSDRGHRSPLSKRYDIVNCNPEYESHIYGKSGMQVAKPAADVAKQCVLDLYELHLCQVDWQLELSDGMHPGAATYSRRITSQQAERLFGFHPFSHTALFLLQNRLSGGMISMLNKQANITRLGVSSRWTRPAPAVMVKPAKNNVRPTSAASSDTSSEIKSVANSSVAPTSDVLQREGAVKGSGRRQSVGAGSPDGRRASISASGSPAKSVAVISTSGRAASPGKSGSTVPNSNRRQSQGQIQRQNTSPTPSGAQSRASPSPITLQIGELATLSENEIEEQPDADAGSDKRKANEPLTVDTAPSESPAALLPEEGQDVLDIPTRDLAEAELKVAVITTEAESDKYKNSFVTLSQLTGSEPLTSRPTTAASNVDELFMGPAVADMSNVTFTPLSLKQPRKDIRNSPVSLESPALSGSDDSRSASPSTFESRPGSSASTSNPSVKRPLARPASISTIGSPDKGSPEKGFPVAAGKASPTSSRRSSNAGFSALGTSKASSKFGTGVSSKSSTKFQLDDDNRAAKEASRQRKTATAAADVLQRRAVDPTFDTRTYIDAPSAFLAPFHSRELLMQALLEERQQRCDLLLLLLQKKLLRLACKVTPDEEEHVKNGIAPIEQTSTQPPASPYLDSLGLSYAGNSVSSDVGNPIEVNVSLTTIGPIETSDTAQTVESAEIANHSTISTSAKTSTSGRRMSSSQRGTSSGTSSQKLKGAVSGMLKSNGIIATARADASTAPESRILPKLERRASSKSMNNRKGSVTGTSATGATSRPGINARPAAEYAMKAAVAKYGITLKSKQISSGHFAFVFVNPEHWEVRASRWMRPVMQWGAAAGVEPFWRRLEIEKKQAAKVGGNGFKGKYTLLNEKDNRVDIYAKRVLYTLKLRQRTAVLAKDMVLEPVRLAVENDCMQWEDALATILRKKREQELLERRKRLGKLSSKPQMQPKKSLFDALFSCFKNNLLKVFPASEDWYVRRLSQPVRNQKDIVYARRYTAEMAVPRGVEDISTVYQHIAVRAPQAVRDNIIIFAHHINRVIASKGIASWAAELSREHTLPSWLHAERAWWTRKTSWITGEAVHIDARTGQHLTLTGAVINSTGTRGAVGSSQYTVVPEFPQAWICGGVTDGVVCIMRVVDQASRIPRGGPVVEAVKGKGAEDLRCGFHSKRVLCDDDRAAFATFICSRPTPGVAVATPTAKSTVIGSDSCSSMRIRALSVEAALRQRHCYVPIGELPTADGAFALVLRTIYESRLSWAESRGYVAVLQRLRTHLRVPSVAVTVDNATTTTDENRQVVRITASGGP